MGKVLSRSSDMFRIFLFIIIIIIVVVVVVISEVIYTAINRCLVSEWALYYHDTVYSVISHNLHTSVVRVYVSSHHVRRRRSTVPP